MIKPELHDPVSLERLARLPADGMTVFTLEGDSVRGTLVNATAMITLAREAHGLGILETLVLGKAYLAMALLSSTLKGADRLALKAEGDGPAQGFSVDCDAAGNVRGRLYANPFELDGPPESLDTGPLLGKGQLTLVRYPEGRTEPVSGSVAMRTGRLAEDLAYFYHLSEQTRTSFSLGIHFDAEGRVAGAGGLFLQALPGASAEALDRVERLVYGLPALGETFATGAGRMDVALRSFPFFDLNLLDERRVEFHCPCAKGRLAAFLGSLPEDELADAAENGPFPLEVKCHNCGSAYGFSQKELRFLLARRKGQSADSSGIDPASGSPA